MSKKNWRKGRRPRADENAARKFCEMGMEVPPEERSENAGHDCSTQANLPRFSRSSPAPRTGKKERRREPTWKNREKNSSMRKRLQEARHQWRPPLSIKRLKEEQCTGGGGEILRISNLKEMKDLGLPRSRQTVDSILRNSPCVEMTGGQRRKKARAGKESRRTEGRYRKGWGAVDASGEGFGRKAHEL